MPSITVHLHVASTILTGWERRHPPPPFSLRNAGNRLAFLQGALAPDMGHVPGGYRLLSDLAHCLRTDRVNRNLVHAARTPLERAFAWGWLTHLLADREVHPTIAEGVGALIDGERGRRVCAFEDEVAHVRVETGVDAHYSLRLPEVRRLRLQPVLDFRSVGILSDAFRATYGLAVERHALLGAHVHATRMWRLGLWLIARLGRILEGDADHVHPGRLGGSALRVLRRGPDLPSVAFLSPVVPPPWLVREIDDALARIPALFHRHYATGLEELRDFNLDSGRVETEGVRSSHPITRRLRSRFGRGATGVDRSRRLANRIAGHVVE